MKIWRRSYDVPPPELDSEDKRHPRFEKQYKNVPAADLPATESLKTASERVMPYWNDTILPQVKAGQKVIVVAHGNSLRAIVKNLSKMSETEILEYNIPTASPFVYEFDENLEVIKKYYLNDEEEIKKKQEAVAN